MNKLIPTSYLISALGLINYSELSYPLCSFATSLEEHQNAVDAANQSTNRRRRLLLEDHGINKAVSLVKTATNL